MDLRAKVMGYYNEQLKANGVIRPKGNLAERKERLRYLLEGPIIQEKEKDVKKKKVVKKAAKKTK